MMRLEARVARQVAARPGSVALVWKEDRLDYAGLWQAAGRIASLLRSAGVRSGDRVCLLLPKSLHAYAAILGVLRAGAVYAPLDTGSPAPRLARMIAACDDRWILAAEGADRPLRELFADAAFGRRHALGWLGPGAPADIPCAFTGADVATAPAEPPASDAPAETAHLLFTSGSTGVPKGVVVTHANVSAFLDWAAGHFGTVADDRVSGHPPLHFDLSTFDLFGTLGAGAALYPVPPELGLAPHRMAAFIRDAGLTQWFSVPSVLNLLARHDAVRPGDFPALRRVLWCGEVLPTATLRHWMARVPQASYTNLYGPTEATIASSYHTLTRAPDDDLASIPIGRPCAGEELLVLDAAMRPVAPGEVGDLYIRGAGLSPGYWRDPEKTAAAFLEWPAGASGAARVYRTGDLASVGPDGLVYFHGRADTQIKTRGYRVELGEVEAALATVPGVGEGVAVALETEGFEGTVIGCGYVPVPGSEVTPAALRAELARVLPAYMLPVRWRAFGQLPRNPNGKVDRRAIRAALALDGGA